MFYVFSIHFNLLICQESTYFRTQKYRKPLTYWISGIISVKLLTGLGPVTSSLPMRCATTCATAACAVVTATVSYTITGICFCQYCFCILLLLFTHRAAFIVSLCKKVVPFIYP